MSRTGQRKGNSHCDIGPLSAKSSTARYRFHERFDFAIPARITNASSTEPYRAPACDVRRGGNDRQQHSSKGLG